MAENKNLRFYEKGRVVPEAAQKQFNNGRFSGTDINPMWRIKCLTELFGPAGLGWYYKVLSERSEAIGDTVMAIVDLELYIRDPETGEWSMPIYGTGGNVLLSKGRASDEGYKMALTDALSVACKALGIGADIYYSKDKTKYTAAPQEAERTAPAPEGKKILCRRCSAEISEEMANASYAESKRILCPDCLQVYRDWKAAQQQKGQDNA